MSRKDRAQSRHKARDLLAEFGDLHVEENRVRYINALIMDSVLPAMGTQGNGLKATIREIERGTMSEVIATFTKLAKATCQRATVMLEDIQRRHLAESRLKTDDLALE